MNQQTTERTEKGPSYERLFRSQDRFYLARCPEQTGTITHVLKAGFWVTFDERNVFKQRVRKFVRWDASDAHMFKVGTPPALQPVSRRGTNNG